MDMESFDQELAQIAQLQAQVDARRAAIRETVIASIQKQIDTLNIKFGELHFANAPVAVDAGAEKRDRTPKCPPKYRNAEGKTWSGRGRKPNWVIDALGRGESLDNYLIEPVAA